MPSYDKTYLLNSAIEHLMKTCNIGISPISTRARLGAYGEWPSISVLKVPHSHTQKVSPMLVQAHSQLSTERGLVSSQGMK